MDAIFRSDGVSALCRKNMYSCRPYRPTAVLAGEWGRNQYVTGRVFSRNQTEQYFQEVEIRLRSTIAPHVCTGYEVFFRWTWCELRPRLQG